VEGLTPKADPPWLVKVRNAVKELEVQQAKPKEPKWMKTIRVGIENLDKVKPTTQPDLKEIGYDSM
jgi:hypothetical protein